MVCQSPSFSVLLVGEGWVEDLGRGGPEGRVRVVGPGRLRSLVFEFLPLLLVLDINNPLPRENGSNTKSKNGTKSSTNSSSDILLLGHQTRGPRLIAGGRGQVALLADANRGAPEAGGIGQALAAIIQDLAGRLLLIAGVEGTTTVAELAVAPDKAWIALAAIAHALPSPAAGRAPFSNQAARRVAGAVLPSKWGVAGANCALASSVSTALIGASGLAGAVAAAVVFGADAHLAGGNPGSDSRAED